MPRHRSSRRNPRTQRGRRYAAFIALLSLAVLPEIALAQDGTGITAHPMGESTAGAHAQGLVQTSMGSFSYAVPIEVPSYFGITPAIGLAYASGRGNGPLGVGWELSGLPVIERASAQRGLPTYGEGDVFLLNGVELVPCAEQTQTSPPSPSCVASGESGSPLKYSVEIEDYQRIRFFAAEQRWEITRPDGAVMIFRPIFDGPYLLPHWVTRAIWRYGLAEVRDLYGHAVRYVWTQKEYPAIAYVSYPGDGTGAAPAAFSQLDRIEYADGRYRIELTWEDGLTSPRPDPIVQATGAQTFHAIPVRLQAIAVRERGNLIRAYQLRYVTGGGTGRSKLSEVQQYGSDASVNAQGTVSGSSSLAPHRFRYWDTAPAWRAETSSTLPWGFRGSTRRMADVDSDGLADIVVNGEVYLNRGG